MCDADVTIIGGGLSSLCCAYYLTQHNPGIKIKILEKHGSLGGTWGPTNRFVGLRSDSDCFTFTFSFEPWPHSNAIGTGEQLLKYLEHTATKYHIKELMQFNSNVVEASWKDEDEHWTLTVEEYFDEDDNRRNNQNVKKSTTTVKSSFIIWATGYYSHEQPHMVDWPGAEIFKKNKNKVLVHSQLYDKDKIDVAGKHVVIIGSGATAVSIVPAILTDGGSDGKSGPAAKKVTQLQRSPAFMAGIVSTDSWFCRLIMPLRYIFSMVFVVMLIRNWTNFVSLVMTFFLRNFPNAGRYLLLKLEREALVKAAAKNKKKGCALSDTETPEEIADRLMKQLTPAHSPWTQRLCAVVLDDPSMNYFSAVTSNKCDLITDHIDRFDEEGIVLKSGRRIDADVVIACTGLRLQQRGGALLRVNGKTYKTSDLMLYRGAMFKDVPNAGTIFGSFFFSWSRVAEPICRYLARLIKKMRDTKRRVVVPRGDDVRPGMSIAEAENFTPSYLTRADGVAEVPKFGDRWPWLLKQNIVMNYFLLDWAPLDDERLKFDRDAFRSAEETKKSV